MYEFSQGAAGHIPFGVGLSETLAHRIQQRIRHSAAKHWASISPTARAPRTARLTSLDELRNGFGRQGKHTAHDDPHQVGQAPCAGLGIDRL